MPRPIPKRNLRFPGPFRKFISPAAVPASLPVGSPTKVQTVSGSSTSGVAAAAITVTAGNTLVVRVANSSGSTNAFTIADTSVGNVWSAARATGFQSGVTFSRIEIWVLFSAAAGTYTITATSAGTQAAIEVEEWTPFGGTVDVASGGGNATSTTVNIPTPASTSAAAVVFTATNFANRTFIDNNFGGVHTPITAVVQGSTTIYGGSAGVTALGRYINNYTLTSTIGSGWAAVSLPYTPGASAALGGTIPTVSDLPTATLTTSITVAGQIDAISGLPTATLNGIRADLAGSIPTVSNLPTATLNGISAALAGTIPTISNLPTSTLTTSITVVGTVTAISNLPTATLSSPSAALAGTIPAVSDLPTAAFTTTIRMTGTVPGVSSLPAAVLTTNILAAGSVAAISNVPTSTLTTSIRMAGQIDAISNLPSTLLANGPGAVLAGQIDAVSALPTAALTTSIRMTGTVVAVSNLPAATMAGGSAPVDLPGGSGNIAYYESEEWRDVERMNMIILLMAEG